MTADERKEIVERLMAGESFAAIAPWGISRPIPPECERPIRDELRRLLAVERKAREMYDNPAYAEMRWVAEEILAAADEETP